MSFENIPIRENNQDITEEWFNTIRTAGISIEGVPTAIETITTDTTLTGSGFVLADSSGLGSGTDLTLTLPSPDSAIEIRIKVKAKNDSSVIINGDGNNIDGNSTYNLTYINESVTVKSDGSNWYIF